MKELEFIELIKNTLADSSFIGDDTAFVEGFAITQDTLIENIHFRHKTITPYELGEKALSVNLSDIAAAGAKPKYVLISLSLPVYIQNEYIKEFYEGINEICLKYNLKVIGGDITGAEKIAISITVIGKAKKPVKRSFAKIGDLVCVTGEHGNSRAGLEILEKNLPENKKFEQAHKKPVPKIEEGLMIAQTCDNPAIMDTSDGLVDALYKIALASKVTLAVDFNKIPFDKNLKDYAKEKLYDWVLFGGEDYELLSCISKQDFAKLKNKINLYPIGEVISKKDFPVIINYNNKFLKIDKKTFENKTFNHFSEDNK